MRNKPKSLEALVTVFGEFAGRQTDVSENAQGCGIFVDLSTMFGLEFPEPMIMGFRNNLSGSKQAEVQKLYYEAMEILSDKGSLVRKVSKDMSRWEFLVKAGVEDWLWDYPILVRKIGTARLVVARSRQYSGYYRIFGDRMGVITAKYISLDQSWYDKWASQTRDNMGVTSYGDLGDLTFRVSNELLPFVMNVRPAQNDQEPDPDNLS